MMNNNVWSLYYNNVRMITGKCDECFEWALKAYLKRRIPDIKWVRFEGKYTMDFHDGDVWEVRWAGK